MAEIPIGVAINASDMTEEQVKEQQIFWNTGIQKFKSGTIFKDAIF